ncbi:glycine zipper 2TM domain-containing protein [Duganella violaceipulchra]|uniref:Glycine zipper 2TM domain-containing protein n=1 Tax=Duganella violaceipulchra TaxID=2849652 RepID=A0AA41HE02_9BURK|nr:glycine zipper 2TM domain-containing protein [Duganella violaceicalia]MBV6323252.1 glycine zipper 2TM domain-containing protein [Duganella violaceicalia]MCP2009960.1 outer membrane lipoprotein SlyB [Duganella violaceicalia]
MKHSTTIAAALIAATAILSGCASTGQQQGSYTNPADTASYGTIESIQIVQAKPGTSGAGAVTGGLVGALLGNQIGSGGGRTAATVAGAVGGAVVGNKVEENRSQPHEQYQISVRMDNGDYRIVNQDSVYDLRAGNRVRLVDGRLYRY